MILNAIKSAYKKMYDRGWDTIYYAVDLHGVVLESNYESGTYTFINEKAKEAMQLLSSLPETVLILWSACHPAEQHDIIEFFAEHDIFIKYFNENPDEASTATGDFSDKFYFSVLFDDKAGFDPDIHWQEIIDHFKK